MPAQIDRALVKAVLAEQLADGLDGSGVTYVRSNSRPPEGSDAWAQIVAVDLTPDRRPKRSGEADSGTFTLTINVAVRKSNEHALDGALSLVANLFDEWVSDETSNQFLETERAQGIPDSAPFEEPEIRTGSVTVEGIVKRSSGITQSTYLS